LKGGIRNYQPEGCGVHVGENGWRVGSTDKERRPDLSWEDRKKELGGRRETPNSQQRFTRGGDMHPTRCKEILTWKGGVKEDSQQREQPLEGTNLEGKGGGGEGQACHCFQKGNAWKQEKKKLKKPGFTKGRDKNQNSTKKTRIRLTPSHERTVKKTGLLEKPPGALAGGKNKKKKLFKGSRRDCRESKRTYPVAIWLPSRCRGKR